MKLIWNRNKPVPQMTRRNVGKVAYTLLCSNTGAFIVTREDPFVYLNLLKEYGVNAIATPVRRSKKLIGYKFKNAS